MAILKLEIPAGYAEALAKFRDAEYAKNNTMLTPCHDKKIINYNYNDFKIFRNFYTKYGENLLFYFDNPRLDDYINENCSGWLEQFIFIERQSNDLFAAYVGSLPTDKIERFLNDLFAELDKLHEKISTDEEKIKPKLSDLSKSQVAAFEFISMLRFIVHRALKTVINYASNHGVILANQSSTVQTKQELKGQQREVTKDEAIKFSKTTDYSLLSTDKILKSYNLFKETTLSNITEPDYFRLWDLNDLNPPKFLIGDRKSDFYYFLSQVDGITIKIALERFGIKNFNSVKSKLNPKTLLINRVNAILTNNKSQVSVNQPI